MGDNRPMEKSEQRKGCFNWNTLKENYLFIILSLFSVMIISLCFQDTINFDEYFSMQWCRMGWKDLMQCLIDDVHPPPILFTSKAYCRLDK